MPFRFVIAAFASLVISLSSKTVLAEELYVAVLPLEALVESGVDYAPQAPVIGGLLAVNAKPDERQIREILIHQAEKQFPGTRVLGHRTQSVEWMGRPSYKWRVRAQILAGTLLQEVEGQPARRQIELFGRNFVQVIHMDTVGPEEGSSSWLARFFQVPTREHAAYLSSHGGFVRWLNGDSNPTTKATLDVATLGEDFCARYFQSKSPN